MITFATHPTVHSTIINRLVLEESQPSSFSKVAQSRSNRRICLCCSNPLLRHISSGNLYWRCNHCYQAMPVIEDAQEMQVFITHDRSLQPLLLLMLLQEPQNFEQESHKRFIAHLELLLQS